MIRRPTSLAQQLAWHSEALNGCGKIVAVGLEPQVGWFKRKLVHGGPFVPAKIWMESPVEDGELVDDEYLRCEVNGVECDVLDAWPRLWNSAITEAEFRYLEATRKWAEQHAPFDPAARPRERLDPLETPVRF